MKPCLRVSAVFEKLLEAPRVQGELRDFEEWFRRYGEHILAYEESKLVVRTAWLARVMLDEGYKLFPDRQGELKDYVASLLRDKLVELGVDPRRVTRGELHGTRSDVLDVIFKVYPNVQQTERPSVANILREELTPRTAQRAPVTVYHVARVESSRLKPLLALALTLLLSSVLIFLLSR
ncbi:hypothetical protein IG193_01200 [Infirmifilum lucidum]|uniref:Uncharacterized protein n=1 Tax=Infirmifilum lucidum TaxID=2776706 RepID=A0A7L9FJA9_9CREN|nr:hypothetical protein [Infirmifilum lucidum]QOJ79113.1 hypothetical protein IG193_01200 [Infirmifilum lucidum]